MLRNFKIQPLKESLNSKGYCQINNILHPQLKEYLRIGTSIIDSDLVTEKTKFIGAKKSNSQVQYSPILGDTLLKYFTKIYSQIADKRLIPTYSYYRKYYKSNTLVPHKDRPACQYSATIQVNSSENKVWPFYMIDKKGNLVKCETRIGDIIFYKGEDVEHWREELKYEYSSHLFLHWVDKDNPFYKKFWFDGRKKLGYSG